MNHLCVVHFAFLVSFYIASDLFLKHANAEKYGLLIDGSVRKSTATPQLITSTTPTDLTDMDPHETKNNVTDNADNNFRNAKPSNSSFIRNNPERERDNTKDRNPPDSFAGGVNHYEPSANGALNLVTASKVKLVLTLPVMFFVGRAII